MDSAQLLNSGLQQLQIELSEEQIQQLLKFVKLLQKWNKAYNLTAIDEAQEIISKHIFDSLSVSPYLYGQRILDVGTGAGLPGIPLAIAHPNKRFILLDSNVKKTQFVQQAKIELGLKNAQIVQNRVEQYLPTRLFNTCISRAFATSPKLFKICEPLLEHLSINGIIIFMLGKQKQLDGIPNSYNMPEIHNIEIPHLKAQRHVAIVKKIAA